jgi:23S rRNA (guanosine2251-2'-O)-methyltransferase
VLAAIEAQPDRVEVVWIAEGTPGPRGREIAGAARRLGLRFQTVPRRKLDAVAGGAAHNGVAARVAPISFVDPQTLLALSPPTCLVGLDGIEDGHNLGAVVRSAAAFRLAGVVVAGPHPPPVGAAAAKVAAGALPRVPLAHVGSLGDFAAAARREGYWVLGAAADGTPIDRVELPEQLLLCLGGEARGLRVKTRRALDGTVAIPIAPAVESLNLAVAAAILAWEWRRRFPSGARMADATA